jgi:hypothetical protein
VSLLRDNLGLKAASLAVAVLIWFVIAGEKTSERGLQVPVELKNIPKDLELTGDSLDFVDVRLRASPGIIHALGPADISAQIDLQGAEEGERIVHLSPSTIRVPFGVQVVKITPSLLTLRFERTLQRMVAVRPRVVGSPAAGHEVGEVRTEPAEVRVAGPRSRVEAIPSAFTEPVSVAEKDAPVTDVVNVGVDDPMLRLIDVHEVKVTVKISEARRERTFEALPVAVRGASLAPRPAQVKVVLLGPASAVDRLSADEVRPYVTVASAPGPAPRARVAVDLPAGAAGVLVATIQPEEVSLKPQRTRGSKTP